jgi:NDP-sugar pyrophosphorylase family protein
MNISEETPIYLAAGGHGSRMRPAMDASGYTAIPKHLLPTGETGGSTLLGRNLRLARESGQKAILLVNGANHHVITGHHDIDMADVGIGIDPPSPPLGPFTFIEHAMKAGMHRSASSAGDVYIADFGWKALLTYHEQSRYPVTLTVGKVSAGPNSAVFDVDNEGAIRSFHRLGEQKDAVYRNVGLYVVDLTAQVEEIVTTYTGTPGMHQRQDDFATDLIAEGLAGAYIHDGPFFNVNTWQDYEALLDYTDPLVEAI